MDRDSLNEIVNTKMSQQRMEDVLTKLTRETSELLKLQVQQETAIWDKKEKYATLQTEYERLQSHARDLQAKCEALDGQLKAERRYQPEIIKKIAATREVCDNLVTKTVQCKQQFAALKKMEEAVLSALQNGDQALTAMKQAQQNMTEVYEQKIQELNFKLKVVTEDQDRWKAIYDEQNKRDQEKIKQLTDQNCELILKAKELNWKKEEGRDAYKFTKKIGDLQDGVENKQNEAKKTIIMKKDKDLQTALEEIGSFKTALNNQETFIKKLCEEKNSLQEQITVLEKASQKAGTANEAYKKNLEDISSMKEALEKNLGALKAENVSLKKERDDQNEEIEFGCQELERSANNKIDKLRSDLENMTKDFQHKTAQITQLEGDKETLTKKLNEVQTALNDYRNQVQDEKKNLNVVIEEKVAELELQANTNALITADLQNEKGERANLEAEFKNARAERKNEMKRTANIERELQAKVSHLKKTIQRFTMPGARREMQSPEVHSTPKRKRTDAPMVERRPFAEIKNFDDLLEMPLGERRDRIFKSRDATAKPKKKRA